MFHMEQGHFITQGAVASLKKYEQLIQKWQKAVNLVSAGSLTDIWQRHILDSAQLYPYLPNTAKVLVDLGSGGGFPGLVLAVLNKENNGPLEEIYLIESDSKKCVFLTEVARELNLKVHVLNERIERVRDIHADVITSRALASLKDLVCYAQPFLKQDSVMLFLKGESVEAELQALSPYYRVQMYPSQTDKKGKIVCITEEN